MLYGKEKMYYMYIKDVTATEIRDWHYSLDSDKTAAQGL